MHFTPSPHRHPWRQPPWLQLRRVTQAAGVTTQPSSNSRAPVPPRGSSRQQPETHTRQDAHPRPERDSSAPGTLCSTSENTQWLPLQSCFSTLLPWPRSPASWTPVLWGLLWPRPRLPLLSCPASHCGGCTAVASGLRVQGRLLSPCHHTLLRGKKAASRWPPEFQGDPSQGPFPPDPGPLQVHTRFQPEAGGRSEVGRPQAGSG